MKTRPPVFHLLLAGALLAAPWQLSIAAPEAKPAATKPASAKPAAKTKMAPRPVPGMAASATDQKQADPLTARSSPNISFAPKPASSTPVASGKAPASGPSQARILMIYRSGTFEPLPADPSSSPPAPPLSEEVRPDSAALPRPGQVRIISKAEADVLAAQPLR